MTASLDTLISEISHVPDLRFFGHVTGVQGLLVQVAGTLTELSIGSRVHIQSRKNKSITCEVIGFRQGDALLMPFGNLEGVGIGSRAYVGQGDAAVFPTKAWLGRVVNALGEPMDGKGPLPLGIEPFALKAPPLMPIPASAWEAKWT